MSPEMGITMLERYEFSNIVVFLAGDRVRNFRMRSETAVYNLYGSTEGVVVAYARIHGDEEEIPVGKGTPGTDLFLVDEAMNEVADGDVGELVYHADFMASEYLKDESRTREKWVRHNGTRYFRTGDRMRRNPDGELIFVGRSDDLVKLRGFRIEMGEVESRVLSSSYGADIHTAVCMVQKVSGVETLCLYYEADSPVNESGLRKELSAVLAGYMVPDFFVCMDRFPRNANGKVERTKLPVPEGAGDTVFYTSIEAMMFIADIYERYQVKIDYREVLGSHTRKELDDMVADAVKLSGKIEKQFERKNDKKIEEAPLSFAQIGVYADCMANPSSTSYNLPMLIEIPDDKSTEDVKRALWDIIKMHPCLNVRFYAGKDGMVIQKIGNKAAGESLCSVRTISADDTCSLEKFIRPFSLNGEDPLYRMEILLCSDGKRILFTDFHHLIFDGSSYRLFLRDLNRRLNGFEIPKEGMNQIEYAYRQNEIKGSEQWNDTHEFWKGRMAVIDEMTSIMPDLYETKDDTGEEHRLSMSISAKPVLDYCTANNVRSSAVYLAAALYTIAGFTAEETIGIATVSGSRHRMEISNTYGMFVNTLPLTAKIPEGRVCDFIVEISELLGEMIENDAYPFSELASEYHITPNIMFACQESLFKGEEAEGENLKYRQVEAGIAKFPVFIEVLREGNLAEIKVRYDSLKYSSRLMERFLQCYLHVISEMLSKEVLHDITFMTKKQMEKQDECLRKDPDFWEVSSSETVLSLLQNSFIHYGNNTAVVFEDREITYRELEERSKAAAGTIIKKLADVDHKCSETVAAVMVPRNEYMVIAPVAALRAASGGIGSY